ncbi:spermine/spermidine synthase domain containing protein [Nitzschia inconspicua]|uniref:Spermine/spermidine synthase domain containing protein n=1 Tax=Nitzschia inconspicua TaxID=303405 RepID=A0A9K3PUI2_9STRA|nr:spermine/spermidine synthase domain containing protein [Nitzschia inconspicua]
MESRRAQGDQYEVVVAKKFVVLSLLLSVILAFLVGRTARVMILADHRSEGRFHSIAGASPLQMPLSTIAVLPDPVLKPGKTAPPTQYMSKTFDTTMSASTQSRWIVTEDGKQQCTNNLGQNDECAAPLTKISLDLNASHGKGTSFSDPERCNNEVNGNEDEREHLPVGQHLLMDIENVDNDFLNSEQRLATAMLELVDRCGLTLLSYHCHKLKPKGVSCAGVLLESHVSFHTWPAQGVITLDLFTCGPNSLLPLVPTVEKLFAVPPVKGVTQPKVVWAHKIRGFDDESKEDIALISDMQYFPVGRMTDFKMEIISENTKFQRVDIYDVILAPFQNLNDYRKAQSTDGSYHSNHPELFEPDRFLYLDGVLQSRRSGDAAYHETLVHPAMFAHANPKRVAIIGGGEGATLREVLKHKTVEKAVMIEIDEILVNVSRQYLPSWSDCSMLDGSASSCFDDARVQTHYIDAFQWFIDTFPSGMKPKEDPFDIIIMDALDPQVQKDFVNALYDGSAFLHSLPNALADGGIFVAQVGAGGAINDPAEHLTLNLNRIKFIESLVSLGFPSIRDFTDGGHSGFEASWQIIAAFKDVNTKADWLANPALVDLKIYSRSLPTIDGTTPFQYFDGPLMQTFHHPSKQSEVHFCKGNPTIKDCIQGHGFDPERENLRLSDTLEVRQSTLGERAGRGVFAKVDIPQSAYIGLDKLIPIIHGSTQTFDLMGKWCNQIPWICDYFWGEELEYYTFGYGHIFSYNGLEEVFVDSTFHCFINHACTAANNVGHNLTVSESNADPKVMHTEIVEYYYGRHSVYNPAADRQVHFYSSAFPLRNIRAGEELFDNYIAMSGRSLVYWNESVTELKAQCNGVDVGIVREYDTREEHRKQNP